MSVFDKVGAYSSKGVWGEEETKVGNSDSKYDITSIEGYLYNKLLSEGFVMEELEPVLDQRGDMLILSGAGSGKTTALIFKLLKDIATGELTKVTSLPNGNPVRVLDSVWVSTFLKTGADEMAPKLRYWQRKFGYIDTASSINFSTIHAEFKRSLNQMGVKTDMLSAVDSLRLMSKAIDIFGIRRGDKILTREDYRVIESIITYVRNRLGDGKYEHPSCGDYGLTPTLIDAIIRKYSELKSEQGKMDFEDLQDLLYKYLYVTPNPAVIDFVSNRYKYIYLDEFQDTSQIQYEIIKMYAKNRGKIVAIGDDDQSIYSWRGGDINIINSEFTKDFNPNTVTLSLNYRCPSNILTPVIPCIERNTIRHKKPLKSYKEGGEFRGKRFKNMLGMLSELSNDIEVDLSEGKSIGILCRTNFDGALPALMLEMSGRFDFSISSERMTLSSPLPRKIVGASSLFMENGSARVRSTLQMFVSRRDSWRVSELVEVFKTNNKSIWNVSDKDLNYSVPQIYDFIMDLRKRKEDFGEIGALKYLYYYMKFYVFDGDSDYEVSARAYIDAMLIILDSKDFKTVFDFYYQVEELNERLEARVRKDKAHIQIATVHEFKGKERDSIYGWNVVEGVFPSSKTDQGNILQVEEERRIFYILCTRAREKLTLYTVKGSESMFLTESEYVFSDVKIGGEINGGTSQKEDSQKGNDNQE